jgi:ribonuclease III
MSASPHAGQSSASPRAKSSWQKGQATRLDTAYYDTSSGTIVPTAMAKQSENARARLLARLDLERAPAQFDQALTHPSYAHEHRSKGVTDYQRLEFLGDAVLDLCVSELLLDALPDCDEGVLSRTYGALVNGESLARWARANEVGPALLVGKGAGSSGIRERTNVLADAVEAIVAAVYLDGGMDEARRVTRLIVGDGLERAAELSQRDAKTALQELVQAHGASAPRYRLLETVGPDHDRQFVVGVLVGEEVLAEGRGRSKKGAEQAAASTALPIAERRWVDDKVRG